MVQGSLYSSRNCDWETPQALFDTLHAMFAFRLDACANSGNAKLKRFFSPADDALIQDWFPYRRVWLNPPYGRDIGQWMAKARTESAKGALVAALVPARTDTRWWHAEVAGVANVTFLRGRLKFTRPGAPPSTAPFPSAIVIYGPRLDALLDSPNLRGAASGGAGARPRAPRRAGRALGRKLRGCA